MTRKRPKSPKTGKKSSGRPNGEALRRFHQANAELRAGRAEAAARAYRRLIRDHPREPQAHNNLGIALKMLGRLDDAAKAYGRALDIAPDYASAEANLAGLLALQSRFEESLPHYGAAMRLEPTNRSHRQGFAAALRPIRFHSATSELLAAVEACLADPGIEHQPLAPAALSLVRLDESVQHALTLAAASDDATVASWFITPDSKGFRDHPILRHLLSQTVLPDLELEALLSRVRRLCATNESVTDLMTREPAFFAALACQCLLNDFAYADSDAERAALETPNETDLLSPKVLTYAMYRPLADLRQAEALSQGNEEASALRLLHLTAPLAEREIEESLQSLTPIEDETSQAVRQQYEDNPYPRWLSARAAQARPLAAILRQLFPGLSPDILPDVEAPLRVLVAGCGTGKHALDVARRYAKADVLAIDLSRRSLAYAARQAGDLGQTNLSFAQADLLKLEATEAPYRLIEAMGVLHHLDDPLAGWHNLVALLEPRGFMRIGLYSSTARQHLEATRNFVAKYEANPDGLRAARQALIALPAGHPARGALDELDFFSLSGCRDLLFHVREVGFSLQDIAESLEGLQLDFLGFEFVDPALPRAYRERFPEDAVLTDLANWAIFEAENPQSFRTMYQFWCRRRD